jgi:lysozyme family protein
MDRNFNRAVEAVLKHEGGFVDHPKDPGGATNKGITIANFRRYVKPNGTVADLKKLTTDQAKTVYRRMYWDAVHGSELPDGIVDLRGLLNTFNGLLVHLRMGA